MIESIHLKNFKCFRDQSIPLGGLTVLAGVNGAGKSTVIQAVLTLHQFWKDEQESTGPWRGPLVNLGSFHDVLHEGSDEDVVRIDVSLSDGALRGERRRGGSLVIPGPDWRAIGCHDTLVADRLPYRWPFPAREGNGE